MENVFPETICSKSYFKKTNADDHLQSRIRNHCVMDKIAVYQKIIVSLINEIAAKPYGNAPGIERQVITDFSNNHFQLINIGWHRGCYTFSPLLHFDIRDGKIWVQHNDTEIEIGDELVARGVDHKDVVFGFIPENERSLVKIAIA